MVNGFILVVNIKLHYESSETPMFFRASQSEVHGFSFTCWTGSGDMKIQTRCKIWLVRGFWKESHPVFFGGNFYGKSRGINFLWSKHDHRSIATWGEIGVLELSWCQLLPSCLTLWRTFCWYLKCSETKLELVVVCLVDPFWHSIFPRGFQVGKPGFGTNARSFSKVSTSRTSG